MRKLLLWLVMVAVMIAAILGGTAAFLYSRTGTDALPQEAVTFGEQTLEPNGWSWVIPVLGDKVNKTYESPTNLTVQKLGTFTDTVPQLVLPDWVTAAELQIAAPDGTRIGHVTSGTMSPCMKVGFGLGYVTPEYAKAGTEIAVVVREKPLRAGAVPNSRLSRAIPGRESD